MELGIRERGETSSTIYENRTALASSVGSNMEMSRVVVQYNADAGLMAEFELTGESFDYSKSVIFAPKTVPGEQITAYLSKIQRGGFIQPFGCMVAIEEPTFKIISYSENCSELLDLNPNFGWSEQSVNLIGLDVRTLFTPSSWSLLAKAVVSKEISLLNPIWVHSRSTHKPFYAILHRIDVGIVIDLEPAQSGDPAILLAGAVRSQKLSAKAISRLQSLPGGDIGVLCDTVVEDVQNLTGYDRVMVYKFHDDDHGEVVSEIRRSYLEPYLGVHYPATDIPQAARFLFKQNRVRMIYDCNANPVQIIQSEELKQPLSLVNSTLRSTHDCHRQYMAGMGSIASLVMAILINGHSSARLWGLVACHHTSPRYVPFPLRYACEFLMQAFGLQLSMEIQLGSQLAEKNVLHTQTFLCDRLLKDAPFGIMNESPNVMDLVKCDGAALYYNEKYWLLGVTPTESQVKEIAEWLLENHGDSTGLSTDSLVASGCPKAVELGDAVCGMATARITSKDFLFWFRSHCAKAIKWGGAKHVPNEKDDDSTMNPRSSFSVFLEVTKNKSPSWEVSEINAIHSLQHIMTDRLKEIEEKSEKLATISSGNIDYEMHRLDEVRSVTFEMVKLIETAIAPIFGVDSSGFINGWNKKMVELTGLESNDACGRLLVDEIVHEDSRGAAQSLLSRALQGEEDKNVELKLQKFGMQQQKSIVYILVNACTSKDYTNNVVGVCFVGQDITSEKFVMKKLTCLEGDYNAIIQSLNPLIPPIFASDVNACCSEWNAAMTKLTGWARHHVIKKSLHGEIFGGLCKLKGQQDALTEFKVFLYKSIGGHDCEKLPFAFFDRKGKFVEVLLTTNKRTDDCGNVIGFLCFFETIEREAQGLEYKDIGFISKGKELAYLRQEMKNPLNGIHFTHKLLESTTISDDQKQLLETSDACGRQIATLIEDVDLGSSLELKMEEFLLGKVIDAIVSQIMNLVKEKNIQVLHDVPEQIKRLCVYGDEIRLQLLLSDFLFNIVHHAAAPDGWVEIKVSHGLKIIQDGNEFVHLHFR